MFWNTFEMTYFVQDIVYRFAVTFPKQVSYKDIQMKTIVNFSLDRDLNILSQQSEFLCFC